MQKISIQTDQKPIPGLYIKEEKHSCALLMVHGFTSSKHAKGLNHIALAAQKLGISSLRIDVWGHKDNTNPFEELTVTHIIKDIDTAIEFLKSQGHTAIGLVGTSLGGLAAGFVASHRKDIACLILKSPALFDVHTLATPFISESLDVWKEKGHTTIHSPIMDNKELNYTFIEDLQSYDSRTYAHTISCPTLIIHGTQDEIVPITQSRQIAKHIPQCTLKEIQTATHSMHSPKELQKLEQHINEFLLATKSI